MNAVSELAEITRRLAEAPPQNLEGLESLLARRGHLIDIIRQADPRSFSIDDARLLREAANSGASILHILKSSRQNEAAEWMHLNRVRTGLPEGAAPTISVCG